MILLLGPGPFKTRHVRYSSSATHYASGGKNVYMGYNKFAYKHHMCEMHIYIEWSVI